MGAKVTFSPAALGDRSGARLAFRPRKVSALKARARSASVSIGQLDEAPPRRSLARMASIHISTGRVPARSCRVYRRRARFNGLPRSPSARLRKPALVLNAIDGSHPCFMADAGGPLRPFECIPRREEEEEEGDWPWRGASASSYTRVKAVIPPLFRAPKNRLGGFRSA